jgi:hypothetical protein
VSRPSGARSRRGAERHSGFREDLLSALR